VRFHRLVLPALVLPAALAAQSPENSSLRGRHMLVGSLGLAGTREASAGPGATTARASGTVASIAYKHYVTPRTGFEIAAAVLEADASSSHDNTRATAVTAFLFGLNFSPASLALSASVRPFLSAAVGSYSRHVAEVSTRATTAARTESQVGARLGVGMNFFVARHFALQLAGDYHAVQPFDAVDGVENDASGFGLSFGLAFVWGGR
jgi:hypothetical protein